MSLNIQAVPRDIAFLFLAAAAKQSYDDAACLAFTCQLYFNVYTTSQNAILHEVVREFTGKNSAELAIQLARHNSSSSPNHYLGAHQTSFKDRISGPSQLILEEVKSERGHKAVVQFAKKLGEWYHIIHKRWIPDRFWTVGVHLYRIHGLNNPKGYNETYGPSAAKFGPRILQFLNFAFDSVTIKENLLTFEMSRYFDQKIRAWKASGAVDTPSIAELRAELQKRLLDADDYQMAYEIMGIWNRQELMGLWTVPNLGRANNSHPRSSRDSIEGSMGILMEWLDVEGPGDIEELRTHAIESRKKRSQDEKEWIAKWDKEIRQILNSYNTSAEPASNEEEDDDDDAYWDHGHGMYPDVLMTEDSDEEDIRWKCSWQR